MRPFPDLFYLISHFGNLSCVMLIPGRASPIWKVHIVPASRILGCSRLDEALTCLGMLGRGPIFQEQCGDQVHLSPARGEFYMVRRGRDLVMSAIVSRSR